MRPEIISQKPFSSSFLRDSFLNFYPPTNNGSSNNCHEEDLSVAIPTSIARLTTADLTLAAVVNDLAITGVGLKKPPYANTPLLSKTRPIFVGSFSGWLLLATSMVACFSILRHAVYFPKSSSLSQTLGQTCPRLGRLRFRTLANDCSWSF